jgi:hypothetical protein
VSEIKVDTVKGRDGVVLLGDSGDTISVPSGATLTTTDATVNTGTVTATAESKTNKISPASGTAFTFGDSGDTFTVPSGVTLANSGTASGFGAGPVLIQSQTFAAQTVVNFTTGIDSTYDEYMFIFININPSAEPTELKFKVSTNGGTSYAGPFYTSFFMAHHNPGNGAGDVIYQSSYDEANGTNQALFRSLGSGSTESCSGIMRLYAPSSTTYVKQFSSDIQGVCYDPQSYRCFVGGYVKTTSAVDAVQFYISSGTFDGIIKLYGVS